MPSPLPSATVSQPRLVMTVAISGIPSRLKSATTANVWFSESQQREGSIEYNYRRGGHAMDDTAVLPEPVVRQAAACGTDAPTYTRDRPGLSTFILQDGVVYHTYSAYARGLDGLWGMYQWLDRAPLGRNESGIWWRHRDKY